MIMGEWVFVCHVPRVDTAIGLCIAGCGDIEEFCETVIGLGEPTDVAE